MGQLWAAQAGGLPEQAAVVLAAASRNHAFSALRADKNAWKHVMGKSSSESPGPRTATPMSSPESKRAKGLRSPRGLKKRQLTPDQDVKNVSYGDPTAHGLSQLSDIVSLETQPVRLPVLGSSLTSAECKADGDGLTQPALTQDLTAAPELPSQPDIPPPDLSSPALVYTSVASGAALHQQSPSLAGALVQAGSYVVPINHQLHQQALPQSGAAQHQEEGNNDDPTAQRSKAARRGPMDEMRQLVRILVKIIPHSVEHLATAEEGGGGNRISEERIKSFLDSTLGEAPRPSWGVPHGWGQYLSELFTWILQHPVSKEQAMRCAKREPGRSWEAIRSELRKLGIHPHTWPLPLTRQGLLKAAQDPIPQPVPSAGKRPSEDTKATASTKAAAPKRRSTGAVADPEALSEVECWQHILRLLHAARKKLGTTLTTDAGLPQLRAEAVSLVNEMCGGQVQPMPGTYAVPVLVPGPNGQSHLAYSVLGGMGAPPQHPSWQVPGVVPAPAPAAAANVSGASGQMSSPMLGMVQPSASQLSGMGPSQLLLSQPYIGSAFQSLTTSQPQLHLDEAPPVSMMHETPVSHEITKPQAIRPPQPGQAGGHFDRAAGDEGCEYMEAEPAPAMTESHEHDMPTSQEIRLYERLALSVPDSLSDMDLQWPDGSSQKSSRPIRPQPVKAAEVIAPAGSTLSSSAAEGGSVGFRPVVSNASPAPFRHSQLPATSSGLMPVSGGLPGPQIAQSSGAPAPGPAHSTAPAQAGPNVSAPAQPQTSRFAAEAAVMVASSPLQWKPSLSAALR